MVVARENTPAPRPELGSGHGVGSLVAGPGDHGRRAVARRGPVQPGSKSSGKVGGGDVPGRTDDGATDRGELLLIRHRADGDRAVRVHRFYDMLPFLVRLSGVPGTRLPGS
jgi:hypothetical protein